LPPNDDDHKGNVDDIEFRKIPPTVNVPDLTQEV
jgi:hypothetical protein